MVILGLIIINVKELVGERGIIGILEKFKEVILYFGIVVMVKEWNNWLSERLVFGF